MDNTYYVYAWYFISTNEIFHIGKGTGNRCNDTKHSRNKYFQNIISKYSDDIAVKKLVENLTNKEACEIERKLIQQYKQIGQCYTNFHEGGQGGNTGNYNNEVRSQKLSEAAKIRIGEKNPNYGNHWTAEQKQRQSEKLKEIWKDPIRREKMLANRDYSNFTPWNKGLRIGSTNWNAGQTKETNLKLRAISEKLKGRTKSKEEIELQKIVQCKFKFNVYLHDKLIYSCLGQPRLNIFCKEQFGISREIVLSIINNTWNCHFNKYKHLQTLKIIKLDKSVTTKCDECNTVEWKVQPFEAQGSQITNLVDEIV